MRLKDVAFFFNIPDNECTDKLAVTWCWYLRAHARALAAAYYDIAPETIDQVRIKRYLTQWHDYDAIDISRIVEGYNGRL